MSRRLNVSLDLTKLNGNAYVILGAFEKQAMKEGCNLQIVKEILIDAKSHDYDYLLGVISENCTGRDL